MSKAFAISSLRKNPELFSLNIYLIKPCTWRKLSWMHLFLMNAIGYVMGMCPMGCTIGLTRRGDDGLEGLQSLMTTGLKPRSTGPKPQGARRLTRMPVRLRRLKTWARYKGSLPYSGRFRYDLISCNPRSRDDYITPWAKPWNGSNLAIFHLHSS
jgi:hypothetical protein